MLPQATTVLAIKYQQGVVIAGDRRATEGFQIADRRIEKVFKIDEYSAMAIAGMVAALSPTGEVVARLAFLGG